MHAWRCTHAQATFSEVPVTAVTATATARVAADILATLGIAGRVQRFKVRRCRACGPQRSAHGVVPHTVHMLAAHMLAHACAPPLARAARRRWASSAATSSSQCARSSTALTSRAGRSPCPPSWITFWTRMTWRRWAAVHAAAGQPQPLWRGCSSHADSGAGCACRSHTWKGRRRRRRRLRRAPGARARTRRRLPRGRAASCTACRAMSASKSAGGWRRALQQALVGT